MLVIDVQGARQVRAARHRPHVGIFVLPPSFEVLEQRLRGRSKDSEEAMQRRLAGRARAEVSAFDEYDYVVDQRRARVDASSGCRRSSLAERARAAPHAADGRRDHQDVSGD